MNHLTKKLMAWIWLPLAAAATLSSCDMMTEDRDDCPTGLYLTFKYDYNLQRADMFGDHVGAVDVYVFDKDGKYVKTLSEANAASVRPLASPTYAMHANLAPGKYKFIVLAGQATYADQLNSQRATFMRSELQRGDDMQKLDIRLETTQEGEAVVRVDNKGLPLDTLWHGMELEPVQVYAEKPTYHTISLMRDTKKISVTLRDIDAPHEVDVNDLIANVMSTFKIKVEKFGGTIDADLSAEDMIVSVDEMHFTNVIFNLLDNAVKYRREDVALELFIRTRTHGDKVEISIQDNGIGIKKEDIKKIFDKFYRVSTGNRHDVKGFGLGLAYVHKIIKDLKGDIRVESELNEGSTFIITLPLVKN